MPQYWANSYCIILVDLQFSCGGIIPFRSNLDTFLLGPLSFFRMFEKQNTFRLLTLSLEIWNIHKMIWAEADFDYHIVAYPGAAITKPIKLNLIWTMTGLRNVWMLWLSSIFFHCIIQNVDKGISEFKNDHMREAHCHTIELFALGRSEM